MTGGAEAAEGKGAASGPRRALSRIPGWTVAGTAGFVLGAVVWHFVGFWSFVSTVVLQGPGKPSKGSEASAREQPLEARRAPTGRIPLQTAVSAPSRCSALDLNRSTGAVSVDDCGNVSVDFSVRSAGRADRAASAQEPASEPGGEWIVQVDARTEP